MVKKIKNRMDKHNKGLFSFIFRLILLVLIVYLVWNLYPILFGKPNDQATSSVSYSLVNESGDKSKNETEESFESEEDSAANKEAVSSEEQDIRNLMYRKELDSAEVTKTVADKYDNSYGEASIVTMSVPKVKMNELSVVRGIGDGNGDFNQLMKICAATQGQILGGNNYLIVSHSEPGSEINKSNSLFTKLIMDRSNNQISRWDIDNLMIEFGDDIVISEGEYTFVFKVSDIAQTNGSESSKYTSRDGKGRIVTLQACLNYEETEEAKRLIFIVGDLYSVSKGQTTVLYKA